MASALEQYQAEQEVIDIDRLDDLLWKLTSGSGLQLEALDEWLMNYAVEEGGAVLLRPHKLSDNSHPSGFSVRMDGKEIKFPPRGRRVEKRMAVRLLQRHGIKGRYTGMDQATGLRIDHIESWPVELLNTYRAYRDGKLNINEVYLSHWTEEMLEQEAFEKAAAQVTGTEDTDDE